jgi:ribosomal protein L11 methylase PrmA
LEPDQEEGTRSLTPASTRLAASYRDPSGFIFRRNGRLFRQVNQSYSEHYDHLMKTGLYAALSEDGSLVEHDEVDEKPHRPSAAYKVIEPRHIPFVSYPYEWCFSQLKAAALLTLASQRRALDFGMTLKDASAYNVQFIGARPVFIDTLSFEKYIEGEPWVAYRQFCQHFLAPLTLMSKNDVRLGTLLRIHVDGIPLDLAASLLPFATRLRPSLLIHLHLHAKTQKAFAGQAERPKDHFFKRRALLGLIDSLESAVRKLSWQPSPSEWTDYYNEHSYAPATMEQKKTLVAQYLDQVRPQTAWDLGANTGVFSRVASTRGIATVAFDSDAACVERSYLEGVSGKETRLLPLLVDLTNPSPGLGWGNRERMALSERGPADLVLALGLIHHLAIGNNVPLSGIAEYLSSLGSWLIIEFVPKQDSQVGRLLVTRKDIFSGYNQEDFEAAFGELFTVERSDRLTHSERTLYLLRKRER